MAHFVAVSGSDRAESFNTRTLALATKSLKAQKHTIENAPLADPRLPLYSQVVEIEQGQPPEVTAFRHTLLNSDGLIIACPEFNGVMPPALLNGLTWSTRDTKGNPDLKPFYLTPCLIVSSSPSGLGGIRAASQLANYLLGLGGLIYPQFLLVANAYQVYDPNSSESLVSFSQKAEQIAAGFSRFCERPS